MRLIKLLNWIIIGILLLNVSPSLAQIAKISPGKPNWGDTVKIIYDPAAEKALFLPGDEVYVVCFVYRENSSEQIWKKLEQENGFLSCRINITPGMSYLTCYFISKEAWDKKAVASILIWKQAGIPSQGAYQQKMLSSSPTEYLEYFQKERAVYPNNYAVFRDKWFLAGAFDKKNQLTMIKQDMVELSQEHGSPIDLLYTLSYGHLVLGNETEGRQILRQMIDKDPNSNYTGFAISNYEYQALSQKIKGEDPQEVAKLKLELFKRAPITSFARQNCIYFAAQKEVPLAAIQAVCEPWIAEEPDNPLPYYALAQVHSRGSLDLGKAAAAIEQAISHTLHGKLRFYKDVSGFMTDMFLPRFYKLCAEIQLLKGNFARALADINAAQKLLKETKADYFLVEAEVWQSIGHMQKAEKALLTSHNLGAKEALGSLQEIYQQRHASLDGFEAYLTEKQTKAAPADSQDKLPAPTFQVETLAGNKLELAKLKGKVVVLNFWFIGCAPCRVEMPGLNTLVQEYQDKDVVFIAFALDKAPALKEFLQQKSFKYQVVAQGGEIAAAYGATVYPTHVIINRKGKIEYFLTGGSETRHEQLRPLIDNLLR